MQDFWFGFGVVANFITVIAGLIAIAGVLWAFFGRARLAISALTLLPSIAPSLTMAITSVGSNPVRDVVLAFGVLDDNGFAVRGDGLSARVTLNRGETLTVVGYEPGQTTFGSTAASGEFRFELRPGDGWYLTVQWQSPLFPWRRSSRTYAWPPALRFACALPEEMRGRKEIKFLKRTRDLSLNPYSPSFIAPRDVRPAAIEATDENFDHLVAAHNGPVFVGFGVTSQGQRWQDVKRMLDAFAKKQGRRVKVLVVSTDECPRLATRFSTNEVPVFKLLLKGEVAKSLTGAQSMPELESEFEEYLH